MTWAAELLKAEWDGGRAVLRLRYTDDADGRTFDEPASYADAPSANQLAWAVERRLRQLAEVDAFLAGLKPGPIEPLPEPRLSPTGKPIPPELEEYAADCRRYVQALTSVQHGGPFLDAPEFEALRQRVASGFNATTLDLGLVP